MLAQLLPVLLPLILIVVLVLVIQFWRAWLHPHLEENAYFKRFSVIASLFDEQVTNVVLSLAFAPGTADKYEQEAQEKGYDIRLVAAVHILTEYLAEQGITLPEDYIVATVEAKLGILKKNQIVPYTPKPTPPVPDDVPDVEEHPTQVITAEPGQVILPG